MGEFFNRIGNPAVHCEKVVTCGNLPQMSFSASRSLKGCGQDAVSLQPFF
ncbi:hypothetical protein HMPREF3038_01739 [Akkermansia sp. KLE1797]|nr:hypothetical protein HMPREF3038_01739 [Akkermansia sp. KLE1797]KXU53943.1 hypothetical protein HMPREF3039_01898 [Akkermansia sp. KLE1798]